MRGSVVSVQLGILMLVVTSAFAQATRTETSGNYSSIFLAHESSQNWMEKIELDNSTRRIRKEDLITTFTLMYPGKTFGIGIELPYVWRRISAFSEESGSQEYQLNGWGDLQIVAKYQFGIYRKYKLLGRERLLKAVLGLVAKIKMAGFSDALSSLQNSANIPAPLLRLGTGARELTVGAVFHTDTRRYFRIHGHLTTTFALTHRELEPGMRLHYTLLLFPVRMEIQNQLFPFVGLKGWWAGGDRYFGENIPNTGGTLLYLSPGFRSVWWYFNQSRIFLQFETALQMLILDTSGNPSNTRAGFYFGARIFLR